jgi:hypothetical protein
VDLLSHMLRVAFRCNTSVQRVAEIEVVELRGLCYEEYASRQADLCSTLHLYIATKSMRNQIWDRRSAELSLGGLKTSESASSLRTDSLVKERKFKNDKLTSAASSFSWGVMCSL